MSDFEYFKPYEGDKPYIFISYAHADDDAVLPIVSDMHRRGYNIWYDEGIEVGSEWQECIASHLADAHLVVAFISNAYMRSDNCRREMHYAQSKKIKTINIFIEETALTPGMELQIGNIFALTKYTYPSDEYFYDKLYSAPLLNSENFADASPRPTTETAKAAPVPPKKEKKEKKKPGKVRKIARWSIAVAVFGVLLAALIVGYFTGYLEKLLTPTTQIETLAADTVCDFKNAVFENAAREYTGKESGDITVGELKGITELELVSCTVDTTNGLEDFTGLTMLRLTGTRGVSDWSVLDMLTALKTVYIDDGLSSSFTGEHQYQIVTE